MRIGLFGFTMTHENMGCQALTCSFLELIKRTCKSQDITIVNFGNENSVGVINEIFPEFRFVCEPIKLKTEFRSFVKKVSKCDILFDVTAGDGFSDIYFTKGTYRDTLIKILCAHQKNIFVLAPQTYGPFAHKSLEYLAGIAIKSADYAFARDQISADYATKISRRKVETVTDMAFVLPFKKKSFSSIKRKIGFNISVLLWKGGFNKENQFGLITDYKEYCMRFIAEAIDKGFEVHLIPHVTKSANANRIIPDGDYPACKEIAKEFPEVILAPCFETPYDAKNYIAGMDYFIGARMHATIGAFSSGVITIPFAYSRKFQGLYEKIGYPYFLDGTKLETQEALDKTFYYIENSTELKEKSKKAMTEVKNNIQIFESELNAIFDLVKRNGKN